MAISGGGVVCSAGGGGGVLCSSSAAKLIVKNVLSSSVPVRSCLFLNIGFLFSTLRR